MTAKAPTKTQQRVLDLIDQGRSAAQVAEAMGTKPNTVHNHVRKMKSAGILPKQFKFSRITEIGGNGRSRSTAKVSSASSTSNGRSDNGLGPAGLKVLADATQTYKQVAIATEKEAESRRGEIADEIAKREAEIEELRGEDRDLQTVVAAARNVEQGVERIEF